MAGTYDTSELRKGVKIMIDGAPYIVVEAQFVKPGKGAAFTRTKMKNLLTGGVIERNIRSGEKMDAANVEEREFTFLYKEPDGTFVFMDKQSYEQILVPAKDRKSTRLNSSHVEISYAVFCLKKKIIQIMSLAMGVSILHYHKFVLHSPYTPLFDQVSAYGGNVLPVLLLWRFQVS